MNFRREVPLPPSSASALPDLGTGQLANWHRSEPSEREEASGRLGFSFFSFLSRRSLQGELGLPSNDVLSENQTESINLSLIVLTFAYLPTSLSSTRAHPKEDSSQWWWAGGVSEQGWESAHQQAPVLPTPRPCLSTARLPSRALVLSA